MTSGIHLFHKPAGPTSFSLVRRCIESARRESPSRRVPVCHGGTLDPFASGLLLMLVGQATRLFDYLHDVPKTYDAVVRWGIETDNGDPLGKVVATGDASSLSPRQLDDVLAGFVGWQEQVPPATSAKRIDGERAYLKAHRGETVVMPPCRVYMHEATWLEHDLPRQSRLRIVVRGGYYVRALARDIGRHLGCGGHIAELRRTSIGPWNDPGPDGAVALRGRELLPWLPARDLTDQEVGALRRADQIEMGTIQSPQWHVPADFPGAQSLVRGFHRERLAFLLDIKDKCLFKKSELRGGI